jgi:hypothetical protein
MRRISLTLIVVFGAGLMTCCTRYHRYGGDDNGRQEKKALHIPKETPKRPEGMQALTVRGTPNEPFTKQDVIDYFKTHNLPRNATTTADFRVDTLEFLSSGEVTARLQGVATGLPDADRVGLVTLSGTFIFTGPPKSRPATFKRAYAVFDARTGNLLMVGTLDSQ